MTTISASGGSTVNISQAGGSTYYRIDSGSEITIAAWPVTVDNNDTGAGIVKVLFTSDIELTATDQYFLCGSNALQFGDSRLKDDGTRPVITINNVTDYPGLIANASHSNINIFNLSINAINSTLPVFQGGWISQSGYAGSTDINFPNNIVNCSASWDTPLNNGSGGIIGPFSPSAGTQLNILGCSTTGEIGGADSGGIAGLQSGLGSGSSLIISECTSSGNISGDNAGGICGSSAALNEGGVIVIKCYSTGSISGQGAGGIFGNSAGNNGNTSATDCYSTGNITGINAGGIFGSDAGLNGGTATATNCYSAGVISGSSADGIFGAGGGGITQQNCYSANGSWSDSAANAALTGINETWLSLAMDTPYILNNFGASPYVLDNIDTANNLLIQTAIENVLPGGSTRPALVPYSNFKLINDIYPEISIDTTTGKIMTAESVVPYSIYTLIIYADDAYSTTSFTLNILQPPPPPPPTPVPTTTDIPCCQNTVCVQASPTTNKDNELLTTYTSGRAIVSNVDRYYTDIKTGARTFFTEPVFKSYRDYMNYLQTKNRYV